MEIFNPILLFRLVAKTGSQEIVNCDIVTGMRLKSGNEHFDSDNVYFSTTTVTRTREAVDATEHSD